MTNVLFNRETLHFVGQGRNPLPFEVEIKNVDVAGLTKEVSYQKQRQKVTEDDKALFLLRQEPIVDEVGREVQVETIENTGVPVMIEVVEKVPLLDETDHQVEYELTQLVTTPAQYDEDGNLISEEKIEQVGTGQFIKCFTTEIKEVQKKDENGLKLFYDTDIVMDRVETPQPALEISQDDARFVEGLEEVKEIVEETKIVTFEQEPNEFTYEDIVKAKQSHITEDTFFGAATLFEEMDESIFSTSLAGFNADLGFDFVSIPAGGEVRTIKLALPTGSNVVGIKTETSDDGLIISIGDTASNLTQVVNNEVSFQSKVSEVYVKFENPTDKRIDVQSFALLV
jgi:hypothetical protein